MKNPVVYFEISCSDNKTVDFYKKIFDWDINTTARSIIIDTGNTVGLLTPQVA